MKDSAVRFQSRVHRALFRWTGGLIGRRLVGNDMLLLTTTGIVSGRPHTVPLLYLRQGQSLVLIASYGGRPRHPQWYLNLVRDPKVRVQIGGSHREMRARTASPNEREALWPRVIAAYSDYAVYQTRTSREIPVVILDPVPDAVASGDGRMLDEDADR